MSMTVGSGSNGLCIRFLASPTPQANPCKQMEDFCFDFYIPTQGYGLVGFKSHLRRSCPSSPRQLSPRSCWTAAHLPTDTRELHVGFLYLLTVNKPTKSTVLKLPQLIHGQDGIPFLQALLSALTQRVRICRFESGGTIDVGPSHVYT
jgi:hypothetical protein